MVVALMLGLWGLWACGQFCEPDEPPVDTTTRPALLGAPALPMSRDTCTMVLTAHGDFLCEWPDPGPPPGSPRLP